MSCSVGSQTLHLKARVRGLCPKTSKNWVLDVEEALCYAKATRQRAGFHASLLLRFPCHKQKFTRGLFGVGR